MGRWRASVSHRFAARIGATTALWCREARQGGLGDEGKAAGKRWEGSRVFHFVAHTMQPDQDNFPPHTGWIHVHVSTSDDHTGANWFEKCGRRRAATPGQWRQLVLARPAS